MKQTSICTLSACHAFPARSRLLLLPRVLPSLVRVLWRVPSHLQGALLNLMQAPSKAPLRQEPARSSLPSLPSSLRLLPCQLLPRSLRSSRPLLLALSTLLHPSLPLSNRCRLCLFLIAARTVVVIGKGSDLCVCVYKTVSPGLRYVFCAPTE